MRRQLAWLLISLVLAPTALAEPPSDRGAAFAPRPLSKPLYGTQPPSGDPQRQQHVLRADDGIDLYVETWLPAEKEGRAPPARVPVILFISPYGAKGEPPYWWRHEVEFYTERGYAVARHHTRGTGESGGCLEHGAAREIDDAARVIEFLGRDAAYSDGNVGMLGSSDDADNQISVAGLGDPVRTQYLKAIVPVASVGGAYDWSFMDGVPFTGWSTIGYTQYLVLVSLDPASSPTARAPERLGCQAEIQLASADQSGDMTAFWKAREYRPGASRIRAATLYVHGLRDFNVLPITLAGWFDRLPATTPHKGLFGVWEHAFPDSGTAAPDWARADWPHMALAWFDRYLKGLPTEVESWPDVQVQDSTGQWRAEREFPSSGGPVGQLALSAGGRLGVRQPRGSTAYFEGLDPSNTGTTAQFISDPLAAPLHLVGQPVLDLWLTTDRDDGHVTALLEVLGADGSVLGHERYGSVTPGARSLRHLDPMPENWFGQERGRPAPVGEPIRVPVRFQPTDLVVPEGGRLRVRISGAARFDQREFQPSGKAPRITILHDCDHSSALRFLLPHPEAPLLNVREHSDEDLVHAPARRGLADGAGLASDSICGKAPERVPTLGPEREPSFYGAPGSRRPPAGCRDARAPVIRELRAIVRRRAVRVRGRAIDAGCAGVRRVSVAVARVRGRRCAFLRPDGRLGKQRPCSRPTFLRAKGRFGWVLRLPSRLAPGTYVVLARAVDRAGNAGKPRRLRARVH